MWLSFWEGDSRVPGFPHLWTHSIKSWELSFHLLSRGLTLGIIKPRVQHQNLGSPL